LPGGAPGRTLGDPDLSVQSTERPQALRIRERSIPDGLKIRLQWVNWRYARQGEKWTKHPYNPRTGKKASSTDLLTWSAFERVFDSYEAGDYEGIGFVLCSGDLLTGIDLDGCRDPESGKIAPWASEIVRRFDSYTEISPSGAGLHILVKGKAPGALKRRGLEMYSVERYLTITGHALSTGEVRP
jgi:putative DNA primase/helicase